MVGDREVLKVRGNLLLWPAREQQPDLWGQRGCGSARGRVNFMLILLGPLQQCSSGGDLDDSESCS